MGTLAPAFLSSHVSKSLSVLTMRLDFILSVRK